MLPEGFSPFSCHDEVLLSQFFRYSGFSVEEAGLLAANWVMSEAWVRKQNKIEEIAEMPNPSRWVK